MTNKIFMLLLIFVFSPKSFACESSNESIYQLFEGPRVISFGEIHGTNEMPAAFSEIVCSFSSKGMSISVGLEIDSSAQEYIDKFFSTSEFDTAKKYLLKSDHWTHVEDGRASKGMWKLMEDLHSISFQYGTELYVYAFSNSDGDNRIEKMTDNIQSVIANDQYQYNLFFTGNLHSQTAIGYPLDPDYQSVAYRLKRQEIPITSVIFLHSGGTAWLCTNECGDMELSVPYPESQINELMPVRYEAFKHDYEFNIGSISSSPPAFD